MKTVSIREAQDIFAELAHEVERGETVVVTRDGKLVFNLVLEDLLLRSLPKR